MFFACFPLPQSFPPEHYISFFFPFLVIPAPHETVPRLGHVLTHQVDLFARVSVLTPPCSPAPSFLRSALFDAQSVSSSQPCHVLPFFSRAALRYIMLNSFCFFLLVAFQTPFRSLQTRILNPGKSSLQDGAYIRRPSFSFPTSPCPISLVSPPLRWRDL